MRTLTSDISTKWIDRLIAIELAMVKARSGVDVMSPQWLTLFQAQVDAKSIRDQLVMHTAADVAVQVRETVNV